MSQPLQLWERNPMPTGQLGYCDEREHLTPAEIEPRLSDRPANILSATTSLSEYKY